MSIVDSFWKWRAGDAAARLSRDLRRGYPVHMYTGRNGAGKSLCAVYDTLPDLEAGTRVLSTVRLLDYLNPRPCDDLGCECDKSDESRHGAAHPAYEAWSTWTQLLDLTDGVALADEVTGIADSHEGAAMPAQVANELAQLRRRGVVLRLTGLNFIRANKRIREACNAVTRCEGFRAVTVRDEDGRAKMWTQRRVTQWSTFDAQSLPVDDHTEHAYEQADKITSSFFWVPGSLAATAYDTYDSVSRIGTVTDAGRCAHCGGTRRAPACECPDYVERTERARRTPDRKPRSGEDRRTSHALDLSPSHGHPHPVSVVPARANLAR